MKNFNYKVYYTYRQSFPKIKGSKEKLVKKNINLSFDSEPSEYEIEDKVKEWINSLQREVMSDIDTNIEFAEIVKVQKLKVVKGIDDVSSTGW